MHGASHESGWRAGTENVIQMAGLGQACELIEHNLSAYQQQMQAMRDQFEAGLKAAFGEIRLNGHPTKRLPNTSSVSFKGVEANTVLDEMEDLAASAGAACHTDRVEVSSVLEAMRVPLEYAMGTLRFSVGRYTTSEEIDRAVAEVVRVVTPHLTAQPVGG
jgi:cysteine desulfurase